jgi:ferritin-like metal-binding protein YciE
MEAAMENGQLKELLIKEVKDIYDAEKQLLKALPKMARACKSEELSKALEHHRDETQEQVSRLEQVFELLEVPARGKSCKGMKGLIEEGSEVIQEEDKGLIRDLALIGGAQRVEHYEIAAYGTARAIAEQMEHKKVAKLLRQTEDEEKSADEKLSEVAESIYEMVGVAK